MRSLNNLSHGAVDHFYQTVAENVKRVRKAKGMSQLELSLELGFKSNSLVSQAEVYYKKQHFNLEHLYKIAYILEVDIEEFFKNVEHARLDVLN